MRWALILLLMTTPALAQPKKALPNEAAILTQVVADAKAALADANQNSDVISAACWTAIINVATVKLQQQQVQGGLLLAFQKLRDITRLNQSPIGTQLIVGCAPLVQDAKLNMLQFFTNIGAVLLLKGVLL